MPPTNKNAKVLMDDTETLHRRARLRELIDVCFGTKDGQKKLLDHIEDRTGKRPNQGELSGLCTDHGKSFADKKARTLTLQIGLHRRWFDAPLGVNLSREDWEKSPYLSLLDTSKPVESVSHLPNTTEAPPVAGRVPLISWIQAGMWNEVIDNLSPGEGERIETTYKARAHTYALRVVGDSMEPRFPEGAILIVEPDEPADHGKFVIVRQRGNTEATFKQLVRDGAQWYLKPLNPRYPILAMEEDAVICGVVKRVEWDVD